MCKETELSNAFLFAWGKRIEESGGPPHSIFHDPSRASPFITSKNLPSYKDVIDFHRRCAYISWGHGGGGIGGGGGGGREE